MVQINERVSELLANPFYQRVLGAWKGKPRRVWVVLGENGCIEFDGATNSKGYGATGDGLVHRLAWISFFGAIPRGLELHHKCKNKVCCNIDHLQCVSKSQHAALDRRPQKLTEHTVRLILGLLEGTATRKEIAERFGVSVWTIHDLARARTWKPTTAPALVQRKALKELIFSTKLSAMSSELHDKAA